MRKISICTLKIGKPLLDIMGTTISYKNIFCLYKNLTETNHIILEHKRL